jgi:hypothetical protein
MAISLPTSGTYEKLKVAIKAFRRLFTVNGFLPLGV